LARAKPCASEPFSTGCRSGGKWPGTAAEATLWVSPLVCTNAAQQMLVPGLLAEFASLRAPIEPLPEPRPQPDPFQTARVELVRAGDEAADGCRRGRAVRDRDGSDRHRVW
jgi:hypothetical protein